MDSHLPDPTYFQNTPKSKQDETPANHKINRFQSVSSLDSPSTPLSLPAHRLFDSLKKFNSELTPPSTTPLLSAVVHKNAPVALDYIAEQFQPHQSIKPKNQMEEVSFEALKSECIRSITNGISSSSNEPEFQTFRNPEEIFTFLISHVSDAEVIIIIQNLMDEIADFIRTKSIQYKMMPEGQEKGKLKEKLDSLNGWLKEKIPIFKAKLDASGIGYSFHYEKLVEVLYNAAELVSAAAEEFTPVASYVTPPLAVIGAGIEGWKLYREKKHLSDIKTWEATFSPKKFDVVYQKQKTIFVRRCEKNRPIVKKFIEAQVILLKQNNIEEVRKNLKNMRCDLPDFEGLDSAALEEKLIKNQDKILHRIVSTQEEASVSIRKALSALGSKKAEMEKQMVQAKVKKSAVVFGCSVLVAALVITFKVLAIAGIAISGAALMGTGFGAVGVIGIATILGLAYFYYKKPNTMKALFSLAYLKMVKNKLVLFVGNLKKRKMAHKISTIARRIHVEEMRIHHIQNYLKSDPQSLNQHLPEIEKYIGKKEKEFNKIAGALKEHLERLETRKVHEETQLQSIKQKYREASSTIEELEKKIKIVELEIAEAGWKDYQRLAQLSQSDSDIASTLAVWLLKDESLLDDEETGHILQTLNIDLKKLRESVDPEQALIEVANVVKGILGAQDEAFVHMIERAWTQKMGIDNGLVQST